MKFAQLSLNELKKESLKVAKVISNEISVDLVIYVAKAGLPIAVFMNEVFKVPLLGIEAQRKGNSLKAFLGPKMKYMPKFIRNIAIALELKSNVHKTNSKRSVFFHDSIKQLNKNEFKYILIVDDSVDTGNSMKAVLEEVKKYFNNASIFSYSLNVWEKSKSVFQTDFYSYENTVIKAPMSKDSKEYFLFCKMYDEKTEFGYI